MPPKFEDFKVSRTDSDTTWHLCDCRNLALMWIMYDLCQNRMYETFPHMGVYAKSPYYVGINMWNLLPVNIRNSNNTAYFKYEIRDRLKRLWNNDNISIAVFTSKTDTDSS